MDHVREEADKMNTYNLIHTFAICFFLLVLMFTGYQLHSARGEIQDVSADVRNGLYNSEGWAVLNGVVMNEQTWAEKNPERYQRYLEHKQETQEK